MVKRDVSIDAYNLVREALNPVSTEQTVALNVRSKRPVREYMDLRFINEVMTEAEKSEENY